jgi:hypothetical protein
VGSLTSVDEEHLRSRIDEGTPYTPARRRRTTLPAASMLEVRLMMVGLDLVGADAGAEEVIVWILDIV